MAFQGNAVSAAPARPYASRVRKVISSVFRGNILKKVDLVNVGVIRVGRNFGTCFMNKLHTSALVCLALFIATTANARGLLGESYFNFSGSFERVSLPEGSIDGWGLGVGGNVPTRTYDTATWGLDANAGLGYSRLTDGGERLEGIHLGGAFVVYPKRWDIGVTPFAGAGVGWRRDRFTLRDNGTISDDTFLGTAVVGVEVPAGPVTLRPYFERTWFEDDGFRNSWSAGLTTSWWVNDKWGWSVTGAYEDAHSRFGGDAHGLQLIAGLLYSF